MNRRDMIKAAAVPMIFGGSVAAKAMGKTRERNEISVVGFFAMNGKQWREVAKEKDSRRAQPGLIVKQSPIYKGMHKDFDTINPWTLTVESFSTLKSRQDSQIHHGESGFQLQDHIVSIDSPANVFVEKRGEVGHIFRNKFIDGLFEMNGVRVKDATYAMHDYSENEHALFLRNLIACRIMFKANLVDGVVTRF